MKYEKMTEQEYIDNAKALKMDVDQYKELMKRFEDSHAEMFATNNDPNHNPYEGWTREEIRHFEDKFHKQPLVGTFTDAPITTTAEIDAEFERAFKGKTFEELFDD